MPIYTIQGPDGRTFKVEAPEGATEEQVLTFVSQQQQPDRAPIDMEANAAAAMDKAMAGRGGYDEFMSGAGKSVMDIADNFGLRPDRLDAGPEVQAAVDRSVETGAGQAGQIAGDVAATLIPGGAAVKGVNALRGAKQLGALGAGAVEGAVSGGLIGGNPVDALQGAALGGALSKSLSMLAPAARRALGGGEVSPHARAIQQMGARTGVDIPMTGGQMVKGGDGVVDQGINRLEEVLPTMPFAGKIGKTRENALKQWNLATMRDIMPRDLMRRVTKTGGDGFDQMRNALSDEYTSILKPLDDIKPGLSDDGMDMMDQLLEQAQRRLTGDKTKEFSQTLWNLVEDLDAGKLTSANIKRAESTIRQLKRKAQMDGDVELTQMYDNLREVIRRERDAIIGPDAAQRLRELDASYSDFANLRDTMGMAGARRTDLFTPEQLDAGWAKGTTAGEKAAGQSPMARRAKQAREVFGAEIPRVGPGTAEKMTGIQGIKDIGAITAGLAGTAAGVPMGAVAGLALPGALSQALSRQSTAKFLTGQYGWQPGTKNVLTKVNKALEDYYQKAGIGAGIYSGEN